MKPWPRKVGVLDVAFTLVLACPGSVIVYSLFGAAGLGGWVGGLLVSALGLLAADGR